MNSVSILLSIVFLINLGFATLLLVNRGGKNGAGYYGVVAAGSAMWVLAEFIFYSLPISSPMIPIATRTLYLSGLVFSPFFLFFSYEFLSTRRLLNRKWVGKTMAPAVFIAFLVVGTDKIILTAYMQDGVKHIVVGEWYVLYMVVVAAYFLFGFVNLFKKYSNTFYESVERRQLLLIFFGSLISVSSGMTFNVVLPYFNKFDYFFAGPLLVVFFISFTTAAIFRYQIFNIKVIFTNVLVLLLWTILLVRALINNSLQDTLADAAVLIVSIPIGILLVRSVLKEVETRERVEVLATELGEANEKLEVLNRQKSEFVSIASHQLRTPLTAIKGYSSMLLEGSFGSLEEKAKEAVSRVFESSERLVDIVEDFLNLSRIELGRMRYEFTSADLKKMVAEVCEELRQNALDKGLTLTCGIKGDDQSGTGETEATWMIWADAGKVRQVLSNIIDNAIKYTTKGGVRVKLEKVKGKFRFSSVDTGIGLSKEDLARLFEKYARSEEAKKVVAGGSGLGLFIAQQIMKAHQSQIIVTSPGKGKGSKFTIDFPKDTGNHATIAGETKASILSSDAEGQPTETG